MNPDSMHFIASAPRGFADLLARELESFGATDVRERSTGVSFTGDLELAYRVCLWSRVANRLFLEIARFEAADDSAFYRAAREIPWEDHIGRGTTIACDFTGRHPVISHTHFGALRLKDAIVDALRDRTGVRPDVEPTRPGVRVHAHAHGNAITVSLDLSGESLHRRGYRGEQGEAPLKENVAAGILMRAGWPALAAEGAEFLDPLCGSGTFVIEAAWMAATVAPGSMRDYFGFLAWRRHDAALWEGLRAQAAARRNDAAVPAGLLRGSDRDPSVIRVAQANARRAGVEALVRFERTELSEVAPLRGAEAGQPATGLFCTNPPYGVRLEDKEAARAIHRELGTVLREKFAGWQAAILTGAADLGLELGIRAHRTHTVWNGALECRLLRLKVESASFREMTQTGPRSLVKPALRETPGAQMIANRLTKNLRRLRTWAERNGVTCFRIYDADMPEYAFAIDLYRSADSATSWLYVQEYAAPADIDEESVRRRRGEALSVLPDVTGVPAANIRLRTRRRVHRGDQYRKLASEAEFHVVEEGGLKFEVNFDDYLDTGLFLDHRITRARLRDAAQGKRFLNLFAYTGTATVYAAAGGARLTRTVDMSRTYLDWARRNLRLNGFSDAWHPLIAADCRQWLGDPARATERYDLIFMDPPTFSNSKRMEGVLDIQRDHVELIDLAMRLLADDGLLVFSNNAQRFKLDEALQARYAVQDISAATLPADFERNPKIHRCYEIRHR